jgi:AraC-like DNA-binding protein
MLIGDKKYCLREGDLITVDSGFTHENTDGKPGGQQLIFEVDERLIRRAGDYFIDYRTVGENSLDKADPNITEVVRKLYNIACLQNDVNVSQVQPEQERSDYYEVLIQQKGRYRMMSEAYRVLEIIHDYIKTDESSVNKFPSDILRNCIEIVQAEYALDLSPEDVARRLGLSVPSFHRMLKNQLGVSFLKYLNSVRISAAEALLLDNNADIIDIPEQCGFSSESNFYRVFREYTGSSPKQYRENRKGVTANVLRPSVLMLNNFEFVSIDQVNMGSAGEKTTDKAAY